MTIDQAVFRFGGFMVLLAAALTIWVDPRWIYLAAFAGVNMLQASFTRFCPAAILFKSMGAKPGHHFQ